MEEVERARLMGLIDKAIIQLSEHFDTVQIFTTKNPVDYKKDEMEAGYTPSFAVGQGNFFARYGQVSEWLICQEQAARNSVRNQSNDPR